MFVMNWKKELQEIKFDTLGEQEEQTLQLSVVKLLGQKMMKLTLWN